MVALALGKSWEMGDSNGREEHPQPLAIIEGINILTLEVLDPLHDVEQVSSGGGGAASVDTTLRKRN